MESDLIDYDLIIKNNPWLLVKDRKCIISPDSDGFLCGLLVTNFLNWKIAGFYDGKILLTDGDSDLTNYVFLDIEINRNNVGSIGNHLVEYNRGVPLKNHHFNYCVQPNILRGFDANSSFQRKYPFGTIHLLLSIYQSAGLIKDLPSTALSPLLFVDGVCNNLFGYPENCLDWITYMRINHDEQILNKFFCDSGKSVYETMQALKLFFDMRDKYNAKGFFNGSEYVAGGRNKRTGHKLRITDTQGRIINLVKNGDLFSIHETEANRVIGFIKEMSKMIGMEYLGNNWKWSGIHEKTYQKGMLSKTSVDPLKRLNNQNYQKLFDLNPLSLAVTASDRIEYTI